MLLLSRADDRITQQVGENRKLRQVGMECFIDVLFRFAVGCIGDFECGVDENLVVYERRANAGREILQLDANVEVLGVFAIEYF